MEYYSKEIGEWTITNYPRHFPYGLVECAEDETLLEYCHIPDDRLYTLEIPTIVDGKRVVGIQGEIFCKYQMTFDDGIPIENPSLHNVVIPEGVKYIGHRAFSRCNNLQAIQLPSSLEYIGNGCFEECSSLKSVKIPDDITVKTSITSRSGPNPKEV